MSNILFALGVLAAGLMGFAIQRGATCTVAAVEEVIQRRSGKQLLAMVEAALWVSAGLFIAQRLHLLGALPGGYALSGWTIAGAVLLGFGAYVNGACVIGAIARLGSGEWAYAATPIGYFLGCASVEWIFHAPAPVAEPSGTFMAVAASGAFWPLVPLMLWRFFKLFRRAESSAISYVNAAVWSPHGATIVIGFTFLATLILVGTWVYTDVLAELARGMSNSLSAGLWLVVALLGGAIWGGYTAGRLRSTRIRARSVLRHLVGGALMAWGSLLIPGGNDGLILIGMPLLWTYAWVGFFTMCATVAVAQLVAQRLARP